MSGTPDTCANLCARPLSRLLRDAVVDELKRRERVAGMLEGAREFELDLETPDGEHNYKGVLTGRHVGEVRGDWDVYLTTDGRVMIANEEEGKIEEVEDEENFRDDFEIYLVVCEALGRIARVEV